MFECLKPVLKFASSWGLDEVNVNVFTSLGLLRGVYYWLFGKTVRCSTNIVIFSEDVRLEVTIMFLFFSQKASLFNGF